MQLTDHSNSQLDQLKSHQSLIVQWITMLTIQCLCHAMNQYQDIKMLQTLSLNLVELRIFTQFSSSNICNSIIFWVFQKTDQTTTHNLNFNLMETYLSLNLKSIYEMYIQIYIFTNEKRKNKSCESIDAKDTVSLMDLISH